MALTYNKATRDLSIKGTITFNDGTQLHITDSDILNYSFDPQIGSEGLPLGATEAASYRLELSNIGKVYTPEKFDNVEVHMFVGIKEGNEYLYDDFGVWYVDECSAPEQSVSLNLSGYDALATRFNAFYEDDKGVYPTTIGSIAQTACLAAGIELKSISFPNAAVQVAKMPKWADETTLRDILSYCAICAGGFARIARNGQLEIVSFADGQTYTLDSGIYQTFTQTGGSAFAFNCIEAILKEDDEEYTRFAIDDSIKSNATNTIQIDYNPLLTSSILNSVVAELRGITMEPGEVAWGGDPSVMCGDYYNVETLNGRTVKIMVTAQSYSFDGGLSVTESCNLPTLNTQTSATYSTSTNMYDAKGNIKATRISGLDKSIVNATVGHFENLTAETAEFDSLLAAYIEALSLVVGKLDAKILAAHSITADQIAAGAITAEKLEADIIAAVNIEAIAAHIEEIVADKITTDKLYAALAKFNVLHARTGYFDKLTVQHLVSQAMNLQYGVGNEVFIENLKVVYAQMVSAAIGNLCIKASDGNYYNIDVNEDGTVKASKVETIGEDEIAAGQTDAGRVILGTDITAENLSTGDLLATYALVNKIDAARIDVDQLWAREAFIALLRTSQIVGGKSITIIAEDAAAAAAAARNAAKTFRQETAPGVAEGVKSGDLWVQPSTGAIRQADTIGFVIDENGVMYLEHASDDGYIARISEDDPYSLEVNFDISVSADGTISGTPVNWILVQDKSILSQLDIITEEMVRENDELRDAIFSAETKAQDAGTIAQKAVEDLGDIPNYLEVTSEGLAIKDIEGASVLRANSGSVSIGTVTGAGAGFSQLAANYVQFGNYQLRRASKGGLVFKMA